MFNFFFALQIEWYHNDVRVIENERFRFVNEGGFHCIDVAPVAAHDAGVWKCIAKNLAGRTISICHLNVLGKRISLPYNLFNLLITKNLFFSI